MAYEDLLDYERQFKRQQGQKVAEALVKKGYQARYVDTSQEAFDLVLSLTPPGAQVGIGGSVTVRQLGLLEALASRGHEVLNHWDPALDAAGRVAMQHKHLACDVFITSTNAITRDGTLINIDYSGNRVAAMIFGPKRVVVVASVKKVVPDIEAGISRTRNVVTPPASKRRGVNSPCFLAGGCLDCKAGDRLCRVTTIMEARPATNPDYHVILVGDDLGY